MASTLQLLMLCFFHRMKSLEDATLRAQAVVAQSRGLTNGQPPPPPGMTFKAVSIDINSKSTWTIRMADWLSTGHVMRVVWVQKMLWMHSCLVSSAVAVSVVQCNTYMLEQVM